MDSRLCSVPEATVRRCLFLNPNDRNHSCRVIARTCSSPACEEIHVVVHFLLQRCCQRASLFCGGIVSWSLFVWTPLNDTEASIDFMRVSTGQASVPFMRVGTCFVLLPNVGHTCIRLCVVWWFAAWIIPRPHDRRCWDFWERF